MFLTPTLSILIIYIFTHYLNICSYRLPITYFILSLMVINIWRINIDCPKWLYTYSKTLFFSSLLLLILTNSLSTSSIYKILTFVLFVNIIGLLMFPVINKAIQSGMFIPIISIVLCIFLSLSLITFLYPNLNLSQWNIYAILGLLAIILYRLFLVNVNNYKTNKAISIFAILIFVYFILLDTQRVHRVTKDCSIKYDYIDNIMNLFLDIVNLFSETTYTLTSK